MALSRPPAPVIVTFSVVFVALAIQLLAVRPHLARRSDAVLSGQDAPRSRGHHAYVALEAMKAVALAAGGILLLAS